MTLEIDRCINNYDEYLMVAIGLYVNARHANELVKHG